MLYYTILYGHSQLCRHHVQRRGVCAVACCVRARVCVCSGVLCVLVYVCVRVLAWVGARVRARVCAWG